MTSDGNITSERPEFFHVCIVNNEEFHMVIAFPSEAYFINYVTICVVNILQEVSTIFLNALTVLVYWRSSQLQNKTSYFFVMLLSLNDIAVGIISNTTFCVILVRSALGLHSRDCVLASLFVASSFSLVSMSFGTLFLLNTERYLSIIHPIFHRNKVTKRRLFKVTVVVWLSLAMQYCIYIFDAPLGRIITSCTICTCLAIMTFMYANIFFRSRGTAVSPVCAAYNKDKSRREFLLKFKEAKSCLIVISCTFVCFLPIGVVGFLEKTTFVKMVLWYWSETLLLTGSTLNSVIFFWRNPILRNEANKIFRQTFSRP